MQLSRCFFAYLIEAAFDCESVRKRIARLLFHFDWSRSDAWKFLQCCFCVLKTSRDYGVFSSLFQQTSLCLSNTYELCARCVFVFSHFFSQTTDDDEIQFFLCCEEHSSRKKYSIYFLCHGSLLRQSGFIYVKKKKSTSPTRRNQNLVSAAELCVMGALGSSHCGREVNCALL